MQMVVNTVDGKDRNPKANHQLLDGGFLPVVNHGISYPPQLVIAGFLNHQQYQYGLHFVRV